MSKVMAQVYKKTNNVWIPKTESYWERKLTAEEKEKYRQSMLRIRMYFFQQNSIPVVRSPEECATGIVKSSSVQ